MSDCHISPDFNTNQCIFYPVKEEEREVLLGDAQSSRGSLTPEGSSAINQTELQTADGSLQLCHLNLFSVYCRVVNVSFNA